MVVRSPENTKCAALQSKMVEGAETRMAAHGTVDGNAGLSQISTQSDAEIIWTRTCVARCGTGRYTVVVQGVEDGDFSIGWGATHRDENILL